MRILKIFILAILSFSLLADCLEAQNKRKNSKKNVSPKISNKPTPTKDMSSIRTLAEGASSQVETPFIFVARSKETYAELKNLVENLPAASEIDFAKTAVVAAFAGTHNTGGYSIQIRKAADKFVIEMLEPRLDGIVTMALTQPFKIVLVPVEEGNALALNASATWTNAMQNYKISSGAFEYSGGFAGRQKQFAVEGTVRVLIFGNLITLDFSLSGKGADKNLKLAEMVSGTIKNEKVEIAKIDVGSFSPGPKPPDKIFGTLKNDKLSLIFEPLPTNVNDGFSARGSIDATKIKSNLDEIPIKSIAN